MLRWTRVKKTLFHQMFQISLALLSAAVRRKGRYANSLYILVSIQAENGKTIVSMGPTRCKAGSTGRLECANSLQYYKICSCCFAKDYGLHNNALQPSIGRDSGG